jgi:hypothetical protein
VGHINNGHITNCQIAADSMEITAMFHNTGGLVGYAQVSHIEGNTVQIADMQFLSTISSATTTAVRLVRIGGIAGCFETTPATMKNNAFFGNITANVTATVSNAAQVFLGGISGYLNSPGENLSVNGNISVSLESDYNYTAAYVGGLFGLISGEVKESYYKGDITANHLSSVGTSLLMTGGIAGNLQGNSAYLRKSYAAGNITSINNCAYNGLTSSTGGLIGVAAQREITDCYFTGNVMGVSQYPHVGGIVGIVNVSSNSYTFSISNCYAAGTVTANGTGDPIATAQRRIVAGGIIGRFYPASAGMTGSTVFLTVNGCAALNGSVTLNCNDAPVTEPVIDNPIPGNDALTLVARVIGSRIGHTQTPSSITFTDNVANKDMVITPLTIQVKDGETGDLSGYAGDNIDMTDSGAFSLNALGWDSSVWIWDPANNVPVLAWQN